MTELLGAFVAGFVNVAFHSWFSPLVIVLIVGWVAGLAAIAGPAENDADLDEWERGVTRH